MATKGPTTLADKLMEQYRSCYGITVENGGALEDALGREYWAHVGQHLRPYDRITLMAADRTWMAELVVLSAGRGYANVKLLEKYDLADAATLEAEEGEAAELFAKWDSPATRWAVIRKTDKMKLQAGFNSKEDALGFIANYRRAA